MSDSEPFNKPQKRTWVAKFRDTFRGVRIGVSGQSSFYVHFVMAVAVFVVAAFLRIPLAHWCLLLMCITVVLTTELLNSAIEWLGRAITDHYDERIRNALDVAGAAVLAASIGSAIIGVLILGYHLGVRCNWWLGA